MPGSTRSLYRLDRSSHAERSTSGEPYSIASTTKSRLGTSTPQWANPPRGRAPAPRFQWQTANRFVRRALRPRLRLRLRTLGRQQLELTGFAPLNATRRSHRDGDFSREVPLRWIEGT